MKLKNIFKIIMFIIISGFLLIFLSGCSKSEVTTISKSNIDTSYDETLVSINKILEKNNQYENVDSIIKNIKFDSYSYTIHIFGPENNDKKAYAASYERILKVLNRYGSL